MIPDKMKALWAEKSGFTLIHKEVPKPKCDEVLIRVEACGICHTDIIIRAGQAHHVVYPFIPGHEFAGRAVAVGEGVRRVKIGDRGVVQQILACNICRMCKQGKPAAMCENYVELGCILDGGMAQYCVFPENCFVPIPDTMTYDEATMVEPMANACLAIATGAITPGDNVVVIGPGPIGIMGAALAGFFQPSKVVLVGTRDERLAIAREHYGVETLNITRPGAEEMLKNELLEGNGADVVMEASGSFSGLQLAFSLAKKGTRICLEGTPNMAETIPFNKLALPTGASVHEISAWRRIDFDNCVRYIAEHKIDPNPLITHTVSIDDWERGFDLASNQKSSCLKVVIHP